MYTGATIRSSTGLWGGSSRTLDRENHADDEENRPDGPARKERRVERQRDAATHTRRVLAALQLAETEHHPDDGRRYGYSDEHETHGSERKMSNSPLSHDRDWTKRRPQLANRSKCQLDPRSRWRAISSVLRRSCCS